MKAKFRYVDLLVAGAVGSLIALVVHHQLRKAKAQKYIDQMGVKIPPVPDSDIDEDDFGDAEAYDYEHFADVLKHMEPQKQDNDMPAATKVDVPSGTGTVDEPAKDVKLDSGSTVHDLPSSAAVEKGPSKAEEKEQASATVANEPLNTESEGKGA